MWKKFLVAGALALFMVPLAAFAQISAPEPYPYPTITPDYDAESSRLDAQALFDGEGEASVAINLELKNVSQEIASVTLSIPGETIRIRRVLQEYTIQKEEEYCDKQAPYDYQLGDYPCLKYATRLVPTTKIDVVEGTSEKTSDGIKLTVPFAQKIAKGETTNIAVAYKATGYTTQRFGVSNFTFTTPTVPFDLDTVRVRVDVQDELLLKGGKAATNYEESLAEGLATAGVASLSSGLTAKFDSSYNYSDAYTKSSQALDPNESFEVSGTYASSWLALYWLQVILVILAFFVFIGLIIWGERRAARLEQQGK